MNLSLANLSTNSQPVTLNGVAGFVPPGIYSLTVKTVGYSGSSYGYSEDSSLIISDTAFVFNTYDHSPIVLQGFSVGLFILGFWLLINLVRLVRKNSPDL